MIQSFIILGGYGHFVWPAFVFTFLSCFVLYLRSIKEFKKQEKLFLNEFKQIESIKIKDAEDKKSSRKYLSKSPIF